MKDLNINSVEKFQSKIFQQKKLTRENHSCIYNSKRYFRTSIDKMKYSSYILGKLLKC